MTIEEPTKRHHTSSFFGQIFSFITGETDSVTDLRFFVGVRLDLICADSDDQEKFYFVITAGLNKYDVPVTADSKNPKLCSWYN